MARNEDYRTFPSGVRDQILEDDYYRCQTCGRLGPERGGNIDLEAHHMQEDPDEIDRDHPENGTTLCIPCHHLVTNRPTADDLAFDIEEVAAEMNLLYNDIRILMFLYKNGPATTGEICEVTSGSSRPATIERLWTLMSADQNIKSLDAPLVDKDAETNEWGLPEDIDTTMRGRTPTTEEELTDRLTSELLRRLLEAGVERSALADFFGISKRATFYIEKRAGALGVPFNDDSNSEALLDEEEFQSIVDGLRRMIGGMDGFHHDR